MEPTGVRRIAQITGTDSTERFNPCALAGGPGSSVRLASEPTEAASQVSQPSGVGARPQDLRLSSLVAAWRTVAATPPDEHHVHEPGAGACVRGGGFSDREEGAIRGLLVASMTARLTIDWSGP